MAVLFGVYLTYLNNFELYSSDISYIVYTFLFKIVIFIFLVISIIYLLGSIKNSQYEQVSLENIVDHNFAESDFTIASLEIAATYKVAFESNRSKIDKKMKLYSKGLNLLYWGFIVFAVHLTIEEVIRFAR